MFPATAFCVVIVVAPLVAFMVEIEKSDFYVNKSQRECVIQYQILSSWVM